MNTITALNASDTVRAKRLCCTRIRFEQEPGSGRDPWPRGHKLLGRGKRLFLARCANLLLAGLFSLLIEANASDTPRASSDKPDCCAKELAPSVPLSDRSIYQLDSSWINDAAKEAKLSSLRGRPQVVSMFFATCQFTCPVLVNDLKRVEAALPENVRTNIGFLLVSFDADRDTPEALAAYRRIHGLPANWTLLRGGADDVLELSALLGVKYKKDLRGQFAHSNVITVLNADGEIVRQIVGLNRDPGETVKAVEQLLAPRGN